MRCSNAWQDIVAKRLYITGGSSCNEHFRGDYDLPNQGNLCETCVTVTWIELNSQLLRLTGEARFAEQLERVVYNQLLGAEHPDGKAWGYYVKMEGKKPYDDSRNVNCCASSGPRGISYIPTFAVTTDADGVVVNLLRGRRRPDLRLRDGRRGQIAHRHRLSRRWAHRHHGRSAFPGRIRPQAADAGMV